MKTVLFVCIENSCRSQMAEGFAKHLGGGRWQAYSAGSRPSGVIHPIAIQVMQEAGIDISRQASKGFDDLPIDMFDYVVSMGCRDFCPFAPAKERIEWNIADPKDKYIDFFREVRDKIKEKVLSVIK